MALAVTSMSWARSCSVAQVAVSHAWPSGATESNRLIPLKAREANDFPGIYHVQFLTVLSFLAEFYAISPYTS